MGTLTIIIVDKSGSLKALTVKDYKTDELYKKCGFKKSEDFQLQTEWPVKLDGQRYLIQMYGKLEGKSNMENKYDFPPPIDKQLFFGACALVGMIRDDNGERSYINLTVELWNKIYERLFGGFEDLTLLHNELEDYEEDDELEHVPKHKKTKSGYLKDGFVVDSSDTEEPECSEEDDDLDLECDKVYKNKDKDKDKDNDSEATEEVENFDDDSGLELSEEAYIESDKE